MKVRFYIAPQTGNGTWESPYRSLINDFIDVGAGDYFTEVDNPSRHISICCVFASDSAHAAIAADSRVVPVGNLAADITALKAHLDEQLSTLSNLAALKASLEGMGISTSWYTSSNTIREGIRYLLRVFSVCQIADGGGNAAIKDLIARNLTVTVAQIPTAYRTAVRNWMQARGLAIGWINNQTTVREILHFIVENLGFGKLRMSGEEF